MSDELRKALEAIAAGTASGIATFEGRMRGKKRLTWYAVNVLQIHLAAAQGTAEQALATPASSPTWPVTREEIGKFCLTVLDGEDPPRRGEPWETIAGYLDRARRMSASSPPLVTEEMVERGGREMYERVREETEMKLPPWDRLNAASQSFWKSNARSCLTAALASPVEGGK